MTAVLELRSVGRVFDGPPEVRALTDVTLSIKRGESVAIVGASGSGKSTLLSLMGGLDQPTTGMVSIAGHDTTHCSNNELADIRASTVGFVFQQYHLRPEFSALQNVADGLLYRGVGRRRRLQEASTALARVGLGDRLSAQAGLLSGGQQQRVAIARALLGHPELLLADEPTGSLDSRSMEEVMNLLSRLHSEGVTLVTVTHNPEVAKMAQRKVHLVDGRTVSNVEI